MSQEAYLTTTEKPEAQEGLPKLINRGTEFGAGRDGERDCIVWRYGKAWILVSYEWNQANPDALENKVLDLCVDKEEDSEDEDKDDIDKVDWDAHGQAVKLLKDVVLSSDLIGKGQVDVNSHMHAAFALVDGNLVPEAPPRLSSEYLSTLPRYKRADLTVTRTNKSGGSNFYKANTADGCEFAYKTCELHKDQMDSFEKELKNYGILARAGVTCVPDIRGGVYLDDGTSQVGFLMDWFARGSLRDNFNASDEQKARWAMELLDAVVEFERHAFEHWDLKCDNILVDDNGNLKVADVANFGWTRVFKHPNKVHQVFSLGKTVLELASKDWPKEGLEEEDVKQRYLGLIGELIWKCCGSLDTPTASEVKVYLHAKFRATRSK